MMALIAVTIGVRDEGSVVTADEAPARRTRTPQVGLSCAYAPTRRATVLSMTSTQVFIFTLVALAVAAVGLGALTEVLLVMWRRRREGRTLDADAIYLEELKRQNIEKTWGTEDS
jgi:hypothetical protein